MVITYSRGCCVLYLTAYQLWAPRQQNKSNLEWFGVFFELRCEDLDTKNIALASASLDLTHCSCFQKNDAAAHMAEKWLPTYEHQGF